MLIPKTAHEDKAMKKFFILLALITLIGLVGWQVYEKVTASAKRPTRRPRDIPVAVEVAQVRKITIRDIGLFTGTLKPRARFIVAPKIAGRLEKLLVNIGDHVKRNQLLAVLEDDEYIQQVDQAQAQLVVAEAHLEESRNSLTITNREFERTKALRKKNIASESDLDAAQARYQVQNAKYKVAMAQIVQREAALKAAKIRLSYTRIQASWETGNNKRVVGERFVDDGALLAPNTPIVSILDIGALIAVTHVIERDFSKVTVGQEAVVSTDAFPGEDFPGKIVRIAPLLKERSREGRIEIEIPNPGDRLKPGMFVRVRIEAAKHDNATVVPLNSLTERKGRKGIFLVDPGERKAQFIPVIVGIINNEWAEVLKPSLSGSVVTLGQHLLRDGSTVILPGGKPKPSLETRTGHKARGTVTGSPKGGKQ
jgi:RND family efflux transporter MFP subunit